VMARHQHAGPAQDVSARHGALSSAFAAATDGRLPLLHPWHLPAAQRAASPASSSSASVRGEHAEDTEHASAATTAAPSQPSPGQTRVESVHSGLLCPVRSADPSGDFARLLSLDLSPSGRIGASPQRRPSGMLRSTESAVKPVGDEGNAGGPGSEQTQSRDRDVTVLLTVHPDDSMAWVTVELIAARKVRHAGQPRHADSSPAAHQAISDQTRAAPDSGEEAGAGHSNASRLADSSGTEDEHRAAATVGAVAAGGDSAPGQSAPADVKPSATEATDPATQASGAAPPVDDWVTALPAVPKLPIRLDTAAAGAKAASGAAAAEPSYADLTAQLAGSCTDASSSSEGSDADEEPSVVSDDEARRERDPRRELELDIAVADALAQVSVSKMLPTQ